jgi:hypothetical protein
VRLTTQQHAYGHLQRYSQQNLTDPGWQTQSLLSLQWVASQIAVDIVGY